MATLTQPVPARDEPRRPNIAAADVQLPAADVGWAARGFGCIQILAQGFSPAKGNISAQSAFYNSRFHYCPDVAGTIADNALKRRR